MNLRIAFFFLFLTTTYLLPAQQITNSDYAVYAKKYKALAIREMQLYKIPASITLAQGMIESGCGKSTLAVESKNHFGIKCQKDWTGDKYYHDDDAKNECFRKYNEVEESFRDHSLFLSTRNRYASLFTLPITDYKGWATGLKQAGYATNPEYANILIRLIESQKLFLLDDPLYQDQEDVVENGNSKNSRDEVHSGNTKVENEGRIIFRKKYSMPVPDDFEYIYTSELGRKVYQNYNVPFIFAQKGDTWYSIAKEFKVFSSQIYRQNDLLKNDQIIPGQMIYLEHKKRKNAVRTHEVQRGESLYSISQEKCIKLALLLRYNQLKPGEEPEPGYVLKLKR